MTLQVPTLTVYTAGNHVCTFCSATRSPTLQATIIAAQDGKEKSIFVCYVCLHHSLVSEARGRGMV